MWQCSFSIMINNFIMITSQFSPTRCSSSMCQICWCGGTKWVELNGTLFSDCLTAIYWFSSYFYCQCFRHFIIQWKRINFPPHTRMQLSTQRIRQCWQGWVVVARHFKHLIVQLVKASSSIGSSEFWKLSTAPFSSKLQLCFSALTHHTGN